MNLPIQTITAYKYKIYRVKHKKDYKDENGEMLEHEVEEQLLPAVLSGSEGVNLNTLLTTFFQEVQATPFKSKYYNKVLKIESFEIDESHINQHRTHCLTTAGFYGRLLKIYHVQKEQETKNVGLNEAVMATYNVFFYFKENSDENICVFHRCGKGGCKTIFMEKFNLFLKDLGLRMEMKAIVSDETKERIKNGRLLEVNLIKSTEYKTKTTDAADKISGKGSTTKRKEYSFTINLRGGKGKAIEGVWDKIIGKVPVKEMFEFVPEDLEFNETSYLVEMGKQQKTIYESNLYAFLCEHDITNLLQYDKYNYPTKESLSFVVDEYVSKLI